MSKISEIQEALSVLLNSGTRKENITVLHANTEYPTPMKDVNLKAMVAIGTKFERDFGYSDPTLGIEVAIAAVSLGAKCIEKHFTSNTQLEGPDHKASLDPNQLKAMITSIRNIELALGEDIKKPSESEMKNIQIVRKSIVAKTQIKKGDILSEKNITTKRPGGGLSPMKWEELIGTTAKKDYIEDDFI